MINPDTGIKIDGVQFTWSDILSNKMKEWKVDYKKDDTKILAKHLIY